MDRTENQGQKRHVRPSINEIPHLRVSFRTVVYLRSRSHSQEMKQGDGESVWYIGHS